MTSSSSSPSVPSLSDLLTAHTAEYSALRGEVCAFHNVEGQIIAIAIALISALTAFLSVILGGQIKGLQFEYGKDNAFIHFIPLPFVALGLVFAYTQVRIVQAAAYLNRTLRSHVLSLLGDRPEIWNWEEFRRHGQSPVRSLATSLNSVRWLFFIAPSLYPLTAWDRTFSNVGAVLTVVWDLALPLLLIGLAYWTSLILPKKVLA